MTKEEIRLVESGRSHRPHLQTIVDLSAKQRAKFLNECNRLLTPTIPELASLFGVKC
jgi:hypothetical protein